VADLEEIRSRLQSIADELADIALDRLREAAAQGGDAPEERKITRARRAVERAAHLLGGAGADEVPEEFFD
jgi:hypothetical protein